MSEGLILFAHGSRDPEWATPLRRLRRMVEAERAAGAVQLAFLEHMPPTLEEAVRSLASRGIRSIAVAPIFLAAGNHLKRDLPERVAALHRDDASLAIRVLPALGESDDVLSCIGKWIAHAR